ncbi:SRPBCC domain-containing protein [Leptospira idonii]|uniref:ATPase n=1 Tax=Leptospira idonii TaxID=1193500 RepID=A0A4R9M1Z7_9LEPT|nr:SRPBCC domain-containing protein [Leptospira idonii]TGN18778.1 ATPase [Leptospira idonii]
MERKTKINAEDGKQELSIVREFDLPVDLLFKAHVDPEIVTLWMGTKVLKLESKKHGSWQFETSDPDGNVMFRAHGVFHDVIPNDKITRTFEMENAPFGVQIEFFEFESLGEEKSRLSIHTVFQSVSHRDQMLKLPFAHGLNMAHNRLEEIVKSL